jgi:hypothetical protein
MRISPTPKEWVVLIRRAAAFGSGFAVWLFCRHLFFESCAQTSMIVPADLLLKREIVGWLWFPFSWLPYPDYGFWMLFDSSLIGLPYGIATAVLILWLFRTSPPKKT